MAKVYIHLTSEQRSLLTHYWEFYRALDDGRTHPTTPPQRRFVAVCHGECQPETEHEVAYLFGRRLVENSQLSMEEILHRGFCVSPRDMKDFVVSPAQSNTNRTQYHAVDVDRFSSKRRWVPRHNW